MADVMIPFLKQHLWMGMLALFALLVVARTFPN
jgi:hypothetical protein